jgi:hypothetical protein
MPAHSYTAMEIQPRDAIDRIHSHLTIQFAQIARINAHLCATVELPSATQKPLCEQDLHRGIDSSLPVLGKRQAGWGECLQGIEVTRLAHRRELAEKTNASRKN